MLPRVVLANNQITHGVCLNTGGYTQGVFARTNPNTNTGEGVFARTKTSKTESCSPNYPCSLPASLSVSL